MEPVAIATAIAAAAVIVGRGSLVVAPAATAGICRRVIFSTVGRVRIFGGGLLLLFAAPLIVTARQAPTARYDATFWIEGLGWIAAAAAVWVIAAAEPWQRFLNIYFATSDPSELARLRAIGAFGVAFGLVLGWVALSVL